MRALLTRLLTYTLIVSVFHLGMFTSAGAALIGTEQVAGNQSDAVDARARLESFVSRAEVADQMAGMGVSLPEALARVRAMTDEEALSAAGELDRLPAGADGLGTLVGAAVFIFIVLLITDILGLTKVFSFTKPIRR